MANYGKWIGGGLGWAFGGVIGAILGVAIGSVFDRSEMSAGTGKGTTQGGFMGTLLILVAAVMKADGKVLRSELDHVKAYFLQSFGEEKTKEALELLKDILQKEIPLAEVCYQIRANLDYASKLQLVQFLIDISKADGHVHTSEISVIDFIARTIGLSAADFNSMISMHRNDTESAYKVLNVSQNASIDDIKKAYREMAKKHHPDRVAHLGEDIRKAAHEKFQKVNEAYEKIKKEKGFN